MQHYLPVAYLNQFAQPAKDGGRLFVVDLFQRRSFWTPPSRVARIHDFYTVDTVDKPGDDIVEQLLASVESNALPVIRKVVGRMEPPDPGEWEDLCTFIAFLEVRVPRFRQTNYEIGQHLTDLVLELNLGTRQAFETTRQMLEARTRRPLGLTYDDARSLLNREGVEIELDLPQGWHIEMMLLGAVKLFEVVRRMTPHLLIATTKARFVTGDFPLPKYSREPRRDVLARLGWATPSVQVYLPLSPRVALVLDWTGIPRVRAANDLVVSQVNTLVAWHSMRYLLCRGAHFPWLTGTREISWEVQALLEDTRFRKVDQTVVEVSDPKNRARRPKRIVL